MNDVVKCISLWFQMKIVAAGGVPVLVKYLASRRTYGGAKENAGAALCELALQDVNKVG